MEQLGFEGMPRRLYSCTPTRLPAWLDCPRRYRMSYLDRPAAAERAALGAQQPRRRRPQRAGRLVAAAAGQADGGGRGPAGRPGLDRRGLRRCNRSRCATGSARSRWWRGTSPGSTRPTSPPGVERTVATRTDKIAVSGRIDRLDARPAPDDEEGTELVVVDYKTGRHLLTVDDARSSLALALYALAAARALRRHCRRVELHHLPSGQVLAWAHTDESLARHLRRAEDIAAECAEADERMRAGCRRSGTTRCSRRVPARRAAGATTCGTAPKAQRGRALRRASLGRAGPASGGSAVSREARSVPELVRARAWSPGASTAGECAAPGMHTRLRSQPPGHLLLGVRGPGVVVLAVDDQRRDRPAWARRSARPSCPRPRAAWWPSATRPVGLLASIRLARNATIGPGTPAATACGSS